MDDTIKLDMTDIDFTKIEKYISIDSKAVSDILKQLGTVINIKGSKLSRGITLKVIDNTSVKVICPNELYYFEAELSCVTTFDKGTCIYIDYTAIQKLSKFFHTDFYIFEVNNKLYIRLITGNLELINPYLLKEELDKLERGYTIKPDKHYVYKVESLLHKLESLSHITDFEVEANKRWINSRDGVVSFKSPLLMAKSNLDFIDAKIDYKVLNYLLYLCNNKSVSDNEIELYEVNSTVIPRYAICFNNTILVSDYPKSSDAMKVLNLFDDLPPFTVIDYYDLKYKMEYADSITYAKGVVTFINRDGKLVGKIKLQNNSESEVEIPVLGEMCLKKTEQIKVNFRILLIALTALNPDPDLPTYFGLRDGLLYLINDNISLAMVTF